VQALHFPHKRNWCPFFLALLLRLFFFFDFTSSPTAWVLKEQRDLSFIRRAVLVQTLRWGRGDHLWGCCFTPWRTTFLVSTRPFSSFYFLLSLSYIIGPPSVSPERTHDGLPLRPLRRLRIESSRSNPRIVRPPPLGAFPPRSPLTVSSPFLPLNLSKKGTQPFCQLERRAECISILNYLGNARFDFDHIPPALSLPFAVFRRLFLGLVFLLSFSPTFPSLFF